MKKSISKILTFTFVIILTGCAGVYKPVIPPALNYNSHDLQDGIGLSYRYDVLREKGNKKYSKKEDKRGIKIISVKITNHTDMVINVGKNVAFYTGQMQLFPMEPMVIKESIKQIVPGYLPYLLLTLTNVTVTKSSYDGISTEVYPVGLVLGPLVTIGNMVAAGSANKKLLSELFEYNILDRDIQPGETVYGLIGIRDIGFSPLSVRIIK